MFRSRKKKEGAAAPAPEMNDEENFLWLEEVVGDAALNWVRAQNKRTEHTLEGDQRFGEFFNAAAAILNDPARIPAPSLFRNTVRNFWQDEAHERGLWREAALNDYLGGAPDWRVILDVDALAAAEERNWVFAGATTQAPQNDRAIVALSPGGSDAAVRREFEISEGRFVEDGFSFPEAKGAVAWRDVDAVYAAIADAEETTTTSGYPRTVRLVARGQALNEGAVVFEGQSCDIGVWPATVHNDGANYTFVTRAVTFFEAEHFLLDESGAPRKLPLPLRSEVEGVVKGRVVATIQEDWRYGGRTFEAGDVVALSGPDWNASLVFRPGAKQAVGALAATQGALLLEVLDNVVGGVLKLTPDGDKWRAEKLSLPGRGSVSLGSVNAYGEDFFLYFDSPSTPSTLYYIDRNGARQEARKTPTFFDAERVVVEQHEARSRDGEMIPYFVIGRKDVVSRGGAPTIQYGYGGFEVPVTPGYAGVTGKLWLEAGGVYVIANIRGGGEFGPRWHEAARGRNRQRSFDDFFAVSADIIASGLTSPEKLGAYGASNGGLLMGVALTQRPDLYRALAIGVPLLDMLRYTKLLAGASWIGEYGDPDDAEDRAALAAYSPFHNIETDRRYPEPFFFTSTKDDRVHPGHARKLAARMGALGHPFLYYENVEGGHSAAANRRQEAYRSALQYVYFHRKLFDGK